MANFHFDGEKDIDRFKNDLFESKINNRTKDILTSNIVDDNSTDIMDIISRDMNNLNVSKEQQNIKYYMIHHISGLGKPKTFKNLINIRELNESSPIIKIINYCKLKNITYNYIYFYNFHNKLCAILYKDNKFQEKIEGFSVNYNKNIMVRCYKDNSNDVL